MLNYILLFVGFIALIKGADKFVESASSIAKKFGIPSIVIGLTIVAIGTSAPEFSVSLQSAIAGMNDISIANVVGSNIFNLLVVLGLSTVFDKLKISNYKDVIRMLLVSIFLLLCSLTGGLTRLEGIILLLMFVGYITSLINQAKKESVKTEEVEEKQRPMIVTIVVGILGLVAIIIGGDLVVDAASAIAQQLGMSENLIGLTIVAVGTSLPELVTSLIATKKGELDIAIGNVVGSNIANILLILGTSAAIYPMAVSTVAIYDMLFMIFTMLLFILMTFKNKVLTKAKGLPLVVFYIAYIIFTIFR